MPRQTLRIGSTSERREAAFLASLSASVRQDHHQQNPPAESAKTTSNNKTRIANGLSATASISQGIRSESRLHLLVIGFAS
jgi:hypothetical protein